MQTVHRLQKGCAELVTAMAASFRPVGRVVPLGTPEPRGREEREAPRQEERMEAEAPRSPGEPQVRPINLNVVSSSSEDDASSAAPERVVMDVALEDDSERLSDKRFMGPEDVHFLKWQRLIPADCKPFTVVQRWHEFRIQRAGGGKKIEQ